MMLPIAHTHSSRHDVILVAELKGKSEEELFKEDEDRNDVGAMGFQTNLQIVNRIDGTELG